MDSWSQILVHINEQTQAHSTWSFVVVTHSYKYYPRLMCLNFSERATELALVATACRYVDLIR